jgi:leader peptidase (prepilin peptidase)/N-methyltransferase
LAWQDLIPLISFFSLGGRCRYCQEKISWQYPLVELASGVVFVLIFFFNGFHSLLTLAYLLVVSSFLILIFTYDFKYLLVPDLFVYIPIVFSLVYLAFFLFSSLSFGAAKVAALEYLFSAFLASGLFGVLVLISNGKWMGSGDIGIGFLMGLIVGWPRIIVALLFSFFIGALVGIILMIAGKKGLKSEIAFGPFLVLGTFLALFFGDKLMAWYLNLFLI